jgi:two-component system nitrate/nitrite response regulator NarL
MKISIVLAEDHNALIDGLRHYVEYVEDIHFLGFANNGRDLVDLVERRRPKVVITDIRMPIMDGIEATRIISKKFPDTRIIAFTMFEQDEAVNAMLEAGAKGYILKNSSLEELLKAIRLVASGESYYDASIVLNTGEKSARGSVLTRRQIEILKLIAQGRTNQEIGDALFIDKTTVETHRKNMIRALHLQGAGELLRYALEKKYDF